MRRLLALSTLAVALVLPAQASAKIVVGVGIAGVSPGHTMTKVKSVLGKPSTTGTGRTEFGRVTTYVYGRPKVEIQFLAGKVVQISTRDTEQRTSTGLGVGSAYTKVRSSFKAERCESASSTVKVCTIGGKRAGQRGTTFRFVRNKVNDVSIGIVLD